MRWSQSFRFFVTEKSEIGYRIEKNRKRKWTTVLIESNLSQESINIGYSNYLQSMNSNIIFSTFPKKLNTVLWTTFLPRTCPSHYNKKSRMLNKTNLLCLFFTTNTAANQIDGGSSPLILANFQ